VTVAPSFWQVSTDGGYIKVASVSNFPISTGMAGALVRFTPGALRQLHWHTGHAEWQYVINGTFTVSAHHLPGKGVPDQTLVSVNDAAQ